VAAALRADQVNPECEDRGMTDAVRIARAMWTLFEPIHAVAYFAPEPRAAFEAAGLRGYWRGYFAGRTAPLGEVGPAPVIAMFSGFAPGMVRRALPGIWSMITPDAALEARAAGSAATLRRLAPDTAAVERAATTLDEVTAALELPGRPLAAANADLLQRGDPHERLWQAATTLREHRGDGHVAALVGAGLAGLPALVLRAALDIGRDLLQPARGWSDDEWDAGSAELTERGLLDAGELTSAARRLLADVEDATDRAAASAWASLPESEITLVAKALSPIARACVNELPDRTPIGDLTTWDVDDDPEATRIASGPSRQ
jgi:hypothetical protein